MIDKPNIVLIIVDQMRKDFVGINGNDTIDTPNLDMMARRGYNFQNAYSAVPSCIASRAALMTGMNQKHHGRVGYEDGVPWNYSKMLPEVFAENGYHTQCIGKMHVYPERKLCGFHNVVLHNGYLAVSRKKSKASQSQFEQCDDYLEWLKNELGHSVDLIDFGLDCNSWVSRPWSYPEYTHPTNWVVTEAIDFLRKKDPTKPFFLKMSFVRPHSPLDPPEAYFNQYQNAKVKEPVVGKWVDENKIYRDGLDVDAKRAVIKKESVIKARRAYSALITHIDHQIGRFLIALDEYDELDNSIILFISDHGDMLGDHYFFRKSVPYEGCTNIPFIVYDPGDYINAESGKEFDEVVELMDVMPSLLDFVDIKIPDTVDGMSIKPLLKGEYTNWREYIHGEHQYDEYSNHYITNGKKKYIWYSQTGREQFFDLIKDPYEMENIINDLEYAKEIDIYRKNLINELKDREEGYTDGEKLIVGKKPLDVLKVERER